MKQTFYLLFALFSLTLLASCGKSGDNDLPIVKELSITSISPDKILNGSKVTITGKNFGTDVAEIRLYLDTSKMIIETVTDTKITFTIPANFIHEGQRTFALQLNAGNHVVDGKLTVYFNEPHGWYYASTISIPVGGSSPIFRNLIFPTDSIGYVQREKYLYRTVDGGISWRGDSQNGGFGLGNAVASSDGKNTWIEALGGVGVSANGETWNLSPDGRLQFGWLTIGLYTNGPASGLIASLDGKLFEVNGSFANATVQYQSKNYVNGTTQLWRKLSALDKSNWVIAGASTNVINTLDGNVLDRDISNVATFSTTKDLQLATRGLAFLVTDQDDLLKLYAGNWTKLTQKANAVCFINATTGYIAYNNKILKTTDAGATWSEEFTLNTTEKVAAIAAKNGKIWVMGNDDKQGFILKYNP